jgi:hypothetical protein
MLRTLFAAVVALVAVAAVVLIVVIVIQGFGNAHRGAYRRGLPTGTDLQSASDGELLGHLKWIEINLQEKRNPDPVLIEKFERDIAAIKAEQARRARAN